MKVRTIQEAWNAVDKMIFWDYEKDEQRSVNAGYPIYFTTAEGMNAWISDLGTRLEINFPDGHSENVWIEQEEQGKDVEITVIAKSGETRTYSTYAEYRKDFRFFWSSGLVSDHEEGTEKHFEKIIQALRMIDEDEAKTESHFNGLTTIFTYKKFR